MCWARALEWRRRAAQATEDSDTAARLDTVIVTGTRAQERTASASLSPIDVAGESLRSSGSSELATVLAKLIPDQFPASSLVDGAADPPGAARAQVVAGRCWCW